ncbi:MAG: hypothetical protein HY342_05095 [Candidatus Lambdaproteobacteria bacterium]|nr:hypothetical protein [Candidatus Lambdaproteobacteria bacterium]
MAAQDPAAPEEDVARAPGNVEALRGEAPVKLRLMKVESEFRHNTRTLPRQERDKFTSMLWNSIRLDFGPKTTIAQLVGSDQKAALSYEHEDALKHTVDYYRSKVDHRELLRVLRFYSAYFLQQARREHKFSKQLFLLFKAADMLRMLSQYSPFAISADAETLVYAIFADLGSQRPAQFKPYFAAEQDIIKAVRRLAVFPSDHRARERLAELYYQQTSFYDAFVQFSFLSRIYPKMPIAGDTRRGAKYLQMANIVQELAHVPRNRLGDARKLRNFIDRYNRDHGGKGMLPLPNSDPARIQKSMASMLPAADALYRQTLAVTRLGAPRLTEAALKLGQNLDQEGRPKEALAVLLEHKALLAKIGASATAWERRLEYINQVVAVAMKLQRRDALNLALEEQRDFRVELERVQQNTKARKTVAESDEEMV